MRLPPAALLALFVSSGGISRSALSQTYNISTFAGGALPVNIPATSANLWNPKGLAVDTIGNLYFTNQNAVLCLDASGTLTLAAGSGTPGYSGDNGPATSAQLNHPEGLAVDSAGNLYIGDADNARIRQVSGGIITTIAGGGGNSDLAYRGSATGAQFGAGTPLTIAVDAAGNLYVNDFASSNVRKVSNGSISTFAGQDTDGYSGDNGRATSALLFGPCALAATSAGIVYIADCGNNVTRQVSGSTITTVAGTASSNPAALAVDSAGNLYIADAVDNLVRKLSNGTLSTVAGTGTAGFGGDGGPALSAQLNAPAGVAVDSSGNLYIADTGNRRIRKVANDSNGTITTVAGNGAQTYGDNGPATSAQLFHPAGIALDSSGNLYIADTGTNRIRQVANDANGVISTVAGNGTAGYAGDKGPAISAQLNLPSGAAADAAGNLLISDTSNNVIRQVSNSSITTVAGNNTPSTPGLGDGGPATSAQLSQPTAVAADSSANLYIADTGNARIRKISAGTIRTAAGNGTQSFGGDGASSISAQLNQPQGIALDASGNLFIADTGNSRIRKVANHAAGVITTAAGTGAVNYGGDSGSAISAQLAFPQGVAVDSAGNLFIADTANNVIRKVSGGVITTIAGTGAQGFSGDNGPASLALLNSPQGVAVDSAGRVYISDSGNNVIRVLTPGAPPAISQNGISPLYGPPGVVQPGEWITIYGTNLAPGTSTWNGDFPTSLGGVSVTIDHQLAYLWSVSPTQINLQVPDDANTGPVPVVIETPFGVATSTVTLAPQAPSFNLLSDGTHVAAEVLTPDGTGAYGGGTYDLAGPSRPAHPGETLILYGVGFGPTNPPVPSGAPFSGAAPTTNPVTVTIGGVPANVAFSGITQAGLYQINITVPDAPAGDQPIQATVNGVQTPPGPVVTIQ